MPGSHAAATARPVRVALIDDDDLFAEAVALALDPWSYHVQSYPCPCLALEAFDRGELPDIILLDLMLPEMDGRHVYAALRSRGALGDVPIIIVSAIADCVRRIGGLGWLCKPVTRDQLEAALLRARGRREGRGAKRP